MVRSSTIMRVTLFAVFMLSVTSSSPASKILSECPGKQEIRCKSLRTTGGFTYPVPLNIPNSGDCEHEWYLNGTCIVHSDGKMEKSGFVVAVTNENLTVRSCEDLKWELRCDSIRVFHCTVSYTVIEPEGQDGNPNVGLPDWVAALIGIGIGIVLIGALMAVWFYCRKRENRSNY